MLDTARQERGTNLIWPAPRPGRQKSDGGMEETCVALEEKQQGTFIRQTLSQGSQSWLSSVELGSSWQCGLSRIFDPKGRAVAHCPTGACPAPSTELSVVWC